jgi:hypothetical protein
MSIASAGIANMGLGAFGAVYFRFKKGIPVVGSWSSRSAGLPPSAGACALTAWDCGVDPEYRKAPRRLALTAMPPTKKSAIRVVFLNIFTINPSIGSWRISPAIHVY